MLSSSSKVEYSHSYILSAVVGGVPVETLKKVDYFAAGKHLSWCCSVLKVFKIIGTGTASHWGNPTQKMYAEMEMRDDPLRFPGIGLPTAPGFPRGWAMFVADVCDIFGPLKLEPECMTSQMSYINIEFIKFLGIQSLKVQKGVCLCPHGPAHTETGTIFEPWEGNDWGTGTSHSFKFEGLMRLNNRAIMGDDDLWAVEFVQRDCGFVKDLAGLETCAGALLEHSPKSSQP